MDVPGDTKNVSSWRKNLYSNSGYKDNYTDDTFLQHLRKNVNQTRVTFLEAALISGRVTEQVCVVSMFIVIYLFLIDKTYDPQTIFLLSSLTALVCYLLFIRKQKSNSLVMLTAHGKTVLIFLLLGYLLSPVLKTLTDSISTDTIYATTFFMMMIHLIFFDYKVNVAVVSNALSTNAAIFGSLCLASRLSSNHHAFILLTIAAECFVLYPTLEYFKYFTAKALLFAVVMTASFLAFVSLHMSLMFISLVVFLNGLCPFLYVRWQRHKDNIYGPWDEAVIDDKSEIY